MSLRKTVAYDPAARAWCVRIQHDLLDLVVQRGGYDTPEEASALGDALIAILLALRWGRPSTECPACPLLFPSTPPSA